MNADGTDPRWRAMLAALLDDDARAVLSETAAPVTGRRRERAIARLEPAGLLDRRAGTAEFRSDVVRELLASSPRAKGPERFLDGRGRIDRYPVRASDREELLRWVTERAFSPERTYTEGEVNDTLEPYATGGDVAVLRRYLVDHELLERTRSGSEYARVDSAS